MTEQISKSLLKKGEPIRQCMTCTSYSAGLAFPIIHVHVAPVSLQLLVCVYVCLQAPFAIFCHFVCVCVCVCVSTICHFSAICVRVRDLIFIVYVSLQAQQVS